MFFHLVICAYDPVRVLSFDQPSGVIVLPDEDWLEESDSDEEYAQGSAPDRSPSTGADSSASAGATGPKRYATYYHHPERRKRGQ